MKPEEKDRIVDTLVYHLGSVPREIQIRQVRHFSKADADLGTRVARGLGIASGAGLEPALADPN
jgi:catalase